MVGFSIKRRAAGLFAGTMASAMVAATFVACDLDLKPFVEAPDGGPPIGQTIVDSGGKTPEPDAAGPEPSDGGADAAEAGRTGPRRIFVTSSTYNGTVGGIEGANVRCMQRAEEAKLDGRFIAWLSTQSNPILPRITSEGPWTLVDEETVVFATKQAIAEGPAVVIDRDENGTKVENPDEVWTGTNANGTPALDLVNCGQWTQNQGNGLVGSTGRRNNEWTQMTNRNCNNVARLYCIEL